MPVLEGNTISVHGSDIDKGKADPTTVKWKQKFKEVSKDFIVAQFTIVATKGKLSVHIAFLALK